MVKIPYKQLAQLKADGYPHSHILTTIIDDISTASSSWTSSVPFNYEVQGAYITLFDAITVADVNISVEVNGVAIDGFTAVVPFTGSVAGQTVQFNAPTTAPCIPGDVLEVITDGGSTGLVKAIVNITVMRRV